METLLRNLRYAVRQIARNPGSSVVVAVTIALGIGATTVIFSLANGLLLRPLPVHEPERLVGVTEARVTGGDLYTLSYPDVLEYREGARDVVRVGAQGFGDVAFMAGGEARVILSAFVTANHFELLGLTPAHGRFFLADEERPGAPAPVAVISHDLWQREFHGDRGVIGEVVRLNSQSLTVVGVAPRGFGGIERGFAPDVWVPIPMYAVLNPGADIYTPGRYGWLVTFGRLEPGVEAPAAEAALSSVARGIEERSEPARGIAGVRVSRLTGMMPDMRGPAHLFFGLLLAMAGLVLLIACVNVAGMLLAQGMSRRREVGIRLALGAGRGRLVSQLMTETTALFLIGGAGGLLLAFWLTDALVALPSMLPGELGMISLDVRPDGRVVLFGLTLSLATALLFGLVPALRASRPELVSALKDGAGTTGGRTRLLNVFVVAQVAVCMLLLVSAGLLGRSVQGALAIDTGVDAAGVTVARVNIEPHGYDEERGRLFFGELTDRLRSSPGVESVSLARQVPLTFTEVVYGVQIPGHEPPPGRQSFLIDYNLVDGEYFTTLRIPVEGRIFGAADGPDAPAVVVVNRTMARRFWPDGDALGQRIRFAGADAEIVGIAGDGLYHSLTEDPIPYMYLPFEQHYEARMVVHVRASPGAGPIVPLLRRELRSLDANVPLVAPASLERAIRISLLPHRMAAVVVGGFGAIGLLLAAVGLYGVLAFLVGRRTREIGLRMALGARTTDVLASVLRQGTTLVLAGLGIGIVLALGATRLLSALLVHVSPTDPLTFAAVSLILVAMALLASYVPARRATRVDPMITLKSE